MPWSRQSFGALALAILAAIRDLIGPGRRHGASIVASRQCVAALVVASLLWLATAGSALALDLVVDRVDDPPPATVQACTAAANDCSLRGAILRANAVAGPHTITLPAGTYTISIQNPSGIPDDANVIGDLDIAQTTTINGAGATSTIITWDETIPVVDRDRVFHVLPAGNLTIRDVTIRQGGRGNLSLDFGGGIRAQGPLTVERTAIRINAQTFGGGVAVSNTTVIRSSTINNNTAQFGAGLYISGSSAFSVLVENSTISTNVAVSPGGGIYAGSSNASTVVTLNNATVALNTADVGGGLAQNGSNSVLLRNTIVAINTGLSMNPNCSGTMTSQGYNLVSVGDTCGMSAATHDVVDGFPELSLLQDNGGPTATHALGFGSQALDRGNPAIPGSGGTACAATDQRGLPRTIDGDSDGIARCDIGATEGGRWLLVDTTADNNALQTCDSLPNNSNCSLRGAISLANADVPGSAFMITLPATGPGNPYRLTLNTAGEDANATGDLDVARDITIVGGGAATTVVDGNGTDRVFDLRPGSSRALRLQDLTVQNGNSGTGPSGGGIVANGSGTVVSLLRVRLLNNVASRGGGIATAGAGVGIFQSAIVGNRAINSGVMFRAGGGIYQTASGTVTLVSSTVADNETSSLGGGMFVDSGTSAVLANVTIAANRSTGDGGGIHNRGSVTSRNSLVASNTAAISGPNCGGITTPTSQGHNLVFGGDTCGFTQGTDKQNQNPQLQPLALNGGTTESMALGGGSAAIDAGNPAAPGSGGTSCTALDQRGTPRPVDGDTVNGPRCDIGAYEAAACTTRPKVALGVAPGSPGRISVTVTAGSGNITELRLHALPQTNIQVSIGALVNQSGELVVPIYAPSTQFTIRRANGTGAGTLPFDVIDGCGLWKTLAGGGPNAWPPGGPGLTDGSDADPPDTRATPATPPPAGCSPRRPDVGLTTTKLGSGRLQTVLTARTSASLPANSLHIVRIGSIANGTVTLNGNAITAGQTVTLPPGTEQATLLLERQPPGPDPGPPVGVSLVVADACGDWGTFVGSGPGT